ncbi:flavodoxin domain-containing protein [Frankia sp. R82]|uniref:flavodoxin domain-containing protein n=1 Tax=Frankia sp. R82 TaxID=2950553 RepID=UPI0020439F1A|nr:flavodoxin domain-containing protein [Frankia sp. R82]MCM3883266.1 flavodoxin domain-containing protein [Frankia sp. R82]
MRALVVYGMRCGGADELARTIGTALAGRGVAADLRPARRVAEFDGYDAVVAAGVVRAGRWSGDLRRLIRNRRDTLAELPVWLVAAEPGLGSDAGADAGSGSGSAPAPIAQLAALASLIGARGALTVGLQLSASMLHPRTAVSAMSGAPTPAEALAGLVEAVAALGATSPVRLLHAVPAWGPGATRRGLAGSTHERRSRAGRPASHLRLVTADGVAPHFLTPREPTPDGTTSVTG